MGNTKKLKTTDGQVLELDGVLYFKCNRPLSITEHMNLIAKVEIEEERVGQKIIIIPHAVDVVRT